MNYLVKEFVHMELGFLLGNWFHTAIFLIR
jgi:hypothetical protein